MFENKLDNIFTDYDESIFSDGSIDSIGLRIIWTSLGNKIFSIQSVPILDTTLLIYFMTIYYTRVQ